MYHKCVGLSLSISTVLLSRLAFHFLIVLPLSLHLSLKPFLLRYLSVFFIPFEVFLIGSFFPSFLPSYLPSSSPFSLQSFHSSLLQHIGLDANSSFFPPFPPLDPLFSTLSSTRPPPSNDPPRLLLPPSFLLPACKLVLPPCTRCTADPFFYH